MLIKLVAITISVLALTIFCLISLDSMKVITRYHKTKTLESLHFQQFQPKVLPDGIKVTDKKLVASVDRYGHLEELRLFIDFHKPAHAGISESKAYKDSDRCEAHNVDTGVSLCQTLKTPKGQKYTHLKDPHRDENLNSETIRFIKSGTFIYINIDVGKRGFIPEAQWQAMIDSFIPIDYNLDPIYSQP